MGVLIRTYLIFTRNIFHDELAYIEIAKNESVLDIFFIKHWIKDHGILYCLFLKPFLSLTSNVIYLRLTNLVFYIVLSVYIFITFFQLGFSYWALVPVFLFTTLRYFIYLNSLISPFNLAAFFAGLVILSFFNIFAHINKNVRCWIGRGLIFIRSSILGFYFDYSFLYLFGLYLFALFLALKALGVGPAMR